MTPSSEYKVERTPVELARALVGSIAWAGRSRATWDRSGPVTYEEAVTELRDAIASLPPIEGSHDPDETTNMWSRRRREVRRMILTRDPAKFLSWTPVVRSMTFGFSPWIRDEFRALRRSDQWDSRWRDALRENRAGLPMPSHVYPPTSGTLIHHAHHVQRYESATGRSIDSHSEIVEFGGGYGSMARLVARLGFRGRYHIHDLREFSAIQGFYLRWVRAEVGEGEVADQLARVTRSDRLKNTVPSDASPGEALFLATWSFGETPVVFREDWLPILARFRYFLIGFHERFEDVDNRTWFDDYVASRPDVAWRFDPVLHRPKGLSYLFGVPAGSDPGDHVEPEGGSA